MPPKEDLARWSNYRKKPSLFSFDAVFVSQRFEHVPVAADYTVHAFTDPTGRPIRAPEWFIEAMENADSR